MKHIKKTEAVKLRSSGVSMSKIAVTLGVSKSTVSLWVRGVVLSSAAQQKIDDTKMNARKKASQTLSNKRKLREESALNSAKIIFPKGDLSLSYRYLVAAFIYECEGAKTSRSTLEFTNSDPKLVAIFLNLIRSTWKLEESKFRVVMHLHSCHNDRVEKDFWSHTTGIPKTQFLKTFKKIESGNAKKKDYRGCVQIKYFDVNIKRMLLAGKSLLAENLGL